MMRRFGSATVAAGAAVALLVGAVAGPGAAAGPRPTGATASSTGDVQGTPPGTVTLPAAAPDFTDVDASNPFAADIAWLAEQGITTGYADGSFRPVGSVNRDAMAAFLFRLVVGPEAPASCTAGPFTDVPATHPFCPQISWLVGEGVTTGWPDGTYRPGSAVSREAMAAFLYRVGHDGADAPACTTARFSDVPVSSPFCGEIAWLAEQGVTTGWPDGTFRPGASIERQAMAAFLHRYAALNPEDPEDPVDPDAPQVSIAEPLPGTMVGGTVTVTVSWSALADLASVALLVDGEVVASADEAPFDLTWDTTVSDEGAHDLAVVATDVEDRAGTSEPVAVVVHQGPNPIQTLEDDYTSGEVTPEDYARYAVYRWSEPDRVPEEYRVPEGYGTDLTEALMVALRDYDTLDADVREELRAYLSPEGVEPLSMVPLTSEEIDAALAPYIEALGTEPSPAVPAEGLAAAGPAGLAFGENTCYAPGVEVKWRIPWVAEGSIGIEGPELGCKYETPLATFWYKIGWATEDVDVLDGVLRDAGDGGGPNGVPDSIDEIAAAFFHATWVYERMGYPAPARTNVAVGEFDGGFSAPVLGTIFVRGTLGSRVYLTQHELFHQFQYPYTPLEELGRDYATRSQSSVAWWLEATAEWGTHQAQRDLRQGVFAAYTSNPAFAAADAGYAWALEDHLGRPKLPLALFVSPVLKPLQGDTWIGPQYGAFLFAEHLHQLYGQGVILDIWQRVDGGALPVDAIGAEVDAQGAAIADVVAGYHRANATLATSYTDAHAASWADRLVDGRPTGRDLGSTTPRISFGQVTVGAGGAEYIHVDRPSGAHASTATVVVDVPPTHAAVDALRVQYARVDGEGRSCQWDTGAVDVVDGHAELTIVLTPGCSSASVVISHVAPGSIGDGDLESLPVSYLVRTDRAQTIGLAGPTTPFAGPDSAVAAVGDYEGGYLLNDDGTVSRYIGTNTETSITRIPGLSGVQQLAITSGANTASAPSGFALTTSGLVARLDDTTVTFIPDLTGVRSIATYWDTAVYALRYDGTLVQMNDTAITPVVGAAGVVQVEPWDVGEWAGGLARTSSGDVLYLVDAVAQPFPGVSDVVDVDASYTGEGVALHADGTMSMLHIYPYATPTDPRVIPVPGVSGAVEIITPDSGDITAAVTADGRVTLVECQDARCDAAPTALDSGLEGITALDAGYANISSGSPLWAVVGGELFEVYLTAGDGTGSPGIAAVSTGLQDVVSIGVSTGLRYAVHDDGVVTWWSSAEWNWPVVGVTTASRTFCSWGRCFIGFD